MVDRKDVLTAQLNFLAVQLNSVLFGYVHVCYTVGGKVPDKLLEGKYTPEESEEDESDASDTGFFFFHAFFPSP